MVIIARSAITRFCEIHPDAGDGLLQWFTRTTEADWGSLADVRRTFNSVDYVGNDRFVFNIKGNKYRLVALIFFDVRTVYIRFIGTHAAYDKIDVSII
jgi:mRNA interferase HigB